MTLPLHHLLYVFRIVSAYLVHHGYCTTAEVFAKSTGQSIAEELSSIRNRQRNFLPSYLTFSRLNESRFFFI